LPHQGPAHLARADAQALRRRRQRRVTRVFELTIWDGLIIAAYVAFCLTVAFSLKRRGERHGLKSFVAADRNMPWWLLGTSMVATTFSAETPLLISGWVYVLGISFNWEWVLLLSGAVVMTI